MNKFGTNEMQPLIDKLRKGSSAIYLVTEAGVADDISAMFKDAADSLEAAQRYHGAVEGAMA